LADLAEAIDMILGQLNLVHYVTNHALRHARFQPRADA
jgi:hypothetical protein